MPDIRIVQKGDRLAASSFEAVTLDFLLLPSGQLDETHELATAVTVALFSDRRADPDDTLPDPKSEDRRGWWGDLDAQILHDGWPIGSRLWLLERAKITDASAREGSTLIRIEDYAREALQPFLDRRIASQLDVFAMRVGLERIDLAVTLYRGPKAAVDLRYEDLWSSMS